ncbi:MAG: hypothetical protein JWM81_1149 [Candidatus Saccharibacteria bacterium]|nr:hypothetical protein [Candidatus Saccharibacteria bacterium]
MFPSDEPELESQHTAFDTKEYAQRLRNSTELRASMRLLVEQEGALERLIDSWVQTDAELPQDD